MAADNGVGRDVFDLDALERDETAAPFRFTAAGQHFEFAHPGDVDWRLTDALEQGSPVVLCKALLGDDQYARFSAIPLPAWKLNKLIEQWGRHVGVDLGESEASSSSSATTVGPSRPTSVVSMASGSSISLPGG